MEPGLRLAALALAGLAGGSVGLGCSGREFSSPLPPTSGSVVNGFGTDGVVTSNPSTTSEYAQAVATDGTDLYVVGTDDSPGAGDSQWRIEKRSLSTGALVTRFGTGGTVTSNPSVGSDVAQAVVSDGTALYVVGSDRSPGTGDYEWRIEKRSLSTGALVTAFGTGGVVTSDPSTGWDSAMSAVTDGANLYIVGHDVSLGSGDYQWRIEKRSLSTGALVPGFGTSGVVLSNPSVQGDGVSEVVKDGADLFVIGSDATPGGGPLQWRIEKRSLSTGALVTGFGSGGVITSRPSITGSDMPTAGVSDGTSLYVVGSDGTTGGPDTFWRVEKRDLASGAFVAGFGAGGAVTSNPSTAWEIPLDVLSDGTDLFIIGYRGDPTSPDEAWRIEKRSLATGELVPGFGASGVVTSDPSSGRDIAYAACLAWTNIFVVGGDAGLGNADMRWRIEKRAK
ncbi:MAG: hypothetical protein L0216_02125 [Planctomycetales bacterium]|nr:hypothetical protein [Planctomycetales bacterium]